MCDKEHYHQLEGRVDKLEEDTKCHEAVSRERFASYDKSMGMLITIFKWVFGAMFIVLLIQMFTVIYGAIGEKGLHSVQHAVQETVH